MNRIFAALTIAGWIILSCFDVVEDLDEIPGQPAISRTSPPDSGTSKLGGWGTFANNMVESAQLGNKIESAIIACPTAICDLDIFLAIRRHSDLHTLHRVFLI